MSFTCGFFDSVAGDRKYNATQVDEIFDGIIVDGIIKSRGQAFAITPVSNSMSINVGTGLAWFNNTWTKNDSTMTIRISASDNVYSRYDLVYLEINKEDAVRTNSIKVLLGDLSINPIRPTITNTQKCYRYPLAYISIAAKQKSIQSKDIENMIGTYPTVYASSMVSIPSSSSLQSEWDTNWNSYFNVIKKIMSDYPATNLVYQIVEKLNVSDKATILEATTGTSDSKWITPATTKSTLDGIRTQIYAHNLGIYVTVKGTLSGSDYILHGG